MSKISVIIPCYNSSLTLGRAIQSVLNQTIDDFEIIIVDDASEDFELTKACINKFSDNRIKYFRHETNKNGSAARNTGILNSQGEYIAFLDADDEWYSEHLKRSLEHIISLASDKYIVYCKNLVKTGGFKDIVMPEVGIQPNEKLSDYLFCRKGYISTPSLFAFSAIFKNIMFNEDLIRHQDYDILLRIESEGYKFSLSDHVGVIVHWENNDTEKKGATP